MSETEILFESQNHAISRRFRPWLAASCLLLSNCVEHVVYYSINLNLKQLLTGPMFQWSPSHISTCGNLLSIFTYLMAFIGGFLTDFFFHRLVLIIFLFLGYLFGVLGIALLHFNSNSLTSKTVPILCNISRYNSTEDAPNIFSETCAPFVLMIVAVIGIGSGMSRLILAVLGADQVRPLGARAVSIYFIVYYMTSNLGAFISDIVINCINGINYDASLIVLAVLVCLSPTIIFCGRFTYTVRRVPAKLKTIFTIIKESIVRRNQPVVCRGEIEMKSYFDRAKECFGGSCNDNQVEGVKRLSYTCILLWVVTFNSMSPFMLSIFYDQALYFRLPTQHSEPIPTSWLQSFQSVGIILVAGPLCLLGIYKLSPTLDVGFTRKRILFGGIMVIISILIAAILETVRLRSFWGPNNPTIEPAGAFFTQHIVFSPNSTVYVTAANMSVFFVAPHFIFSGLTEIFTFTTALEYTYLTNVPWLQCTALGIICASTGLSSMKDSLWEDIILGFKWFDPTNINSRLPCDKNISLPVSNDLYLSTWTDSTTSSPNIKECWESRLDYFYYAVFAIQVVLFSLTLIIIYKVVPQILQSSYIALDDSLQGDDEDLLEEDHELPCPADDRLVERTNSLRFNVMSD